MISSGLCWECREYWNKFEIKSMDLKFAPYIHCHHESREKVKCWCEGITWKPSKEHPFVLDGAFVKFCLECGKRLYEES